MLYVKNEAHFDAAINHRAAIFWLNPLLLAQRESTSYSVNVRGAIWQAVLPLLNNFATFRFAD